MNREEELNTRLGEILKSQGIRNFHITILGNSLATGYSRVNKALPLLERNYSLKRILINHGITPIIRVFSRMQDSNDERLHSWYYLSSSEKERLKFNRHDAKKFNYFTKEELEQYYSLKHDHDDKIKDVLSHCNDEDANVLIYSGATGSFLDNVTRGGLPKKAMSGFKRDFKYLEFTLKEIWNENIRTGKKTQVYLCGVPNYKGLNITEFFINRHLKKIAKKYSNVVYVDAVHASLIYKNGVDVHLSEEEYSEYNNAITESISENYVETNNKINIDKDMYNLAQIIIDEITNKQKGCEEEIDYDKLILDYLGRYLPSFDGLDYDTSDYIKNIKQYIYNQLPTELKKYPIEEQYVLSLEYPEIIVCDALTGIVTSNADIEVSDRVFGTSDGDFIDIENMMANTLAANRKLGKNIQMYVIGTGDSKVDSEIKSIIGNYINVNFINSNRDTALGNDSGIINSEIQKVYGQTRLQIEADRKLIQINEELELLSINKEEVKKARQLVVSRMNPYTSLLTDKEGLRKFFLERAPYDFYYVGKEEIRKVTR